MKEESLTLGALYSQPDYTLHSHVSTTITTNTGGNNATNIIFDEAGQFPQFQQVGNTVWKSNAFISPAEPKGIGALGEIHTDNNGYRFVYTKEGWIQVVNVVGPGIWEQLHGKEGEITKGTKKKLKCF